MVECILFCLNMVAQSQLNLISPFCDKNVSRLLRTSGFNVKFFKNQFDGILYFLQQLRLVVGMQIASLTLKLLIVLVFMFLRGRNEDSD